MFFAESLAISTTAITALLAVLTIITAIVTLTSRIAKTEATVEQLKTDVEQLKRSSATQLNLSQEIGGELKAKIFEVTTSLRELRAELRGRELTGRHPQILPPSR